MAQAPAAATPPPPGGLPSALGEVRSVLGECALWCDRERALYWTDIESRVLWRLADAGPAQRFELPDRLGCFALCDTPGLLLLGLAKEVALYDLHSRRLGARVAVEPGLSTRINDGRCDPQGRFVFGTYNEARGHAAIGGFWRVDAQLRIERLPLPAVAVANGLAFSPDGRRLYFTDSPTRRIQVVDYQADGALGEPRLFAALPEQERGMPDGAAVDSEGGLWSALFNGGCVQRFGADGRADERLWLPVSRPTCPVFGGEGRRTLFVTTARIGLGTDALQREPLAGAVFTAASARQGLPEHRFSTALRP